MDLFGATSWTAVHVGQCNMPQGCDPMLGYLADPGASRAYVEKLSGAIAQAAATMPGHDAYIARLMGGRISSP